MQFVIETIIKVIDGINIIERKHYNYRKGSKQNFNLFSAIVSGKHSREHIEMYHSNILAYLLDPHGSHDCDDLFLRKFWTNLINIDQNARATELPSFFNFRMERERKTDDGRSIDICLESKDFIFFIENKINSGELNNQVCDYRDFAKKRYGRGLGVFLTKDGHAPGSIITHDIAVPILSLSYHFIINWLEDCCKETQLIYTPHILSSIIQYINSLKKLLNIMSYPEKEEIKKYLNANKEKALIMFENMGKVNASITEYVGEIRTSFFQDINAQLYKWLTKQSIVQNSTSKNNGKTIIYHLTYNNVSFDLFVDHPYPSIEDGGKGVWFGFYQNGRNGKLKVELERGHWQGVNFDFGEETAVNDFKEADERSTKILIENYGKDSWNLIVDSAVGNITQSISKNLELIVVRANNIL